MCMGYAKEIKAWAGSEEMERLAAALQQWGNLFYSEDAALQTMESVQPAADCLKDPFRCARETAPTA